MNNENLGVAPQMYVGGDTKQAIEFAWPNTLGCYATVYLHVWLLFAVFSRYPERRNQVVYGLTSPHQYGT